MPPKAKPEPTTPPRPTEHASLAEALAAFQAEMPSVLKSKTAKVPTKSGGQYTYTYADIADVTAAAMPILSAHGLAFTCLPRATATGYELVGRLMFKDESIEGSLPLFGHTNQEIGGAITYSRRYLLGCLTGIVTDEDGDDQIGKQTGAQRTTQRQVQADLVNDPNVAAILAQLAESITVDDVRTLWEQYSIGKAPQNVQAEFHKRVDALNASAQARAQQRVSEAMGGQDASNPYAEQDGDPRS
jgi:hypothetical protein